jgi:hypothetical protein
MIQQEGVAAVVEKYVFSKAANEPRPQMLGRLLGGITHPMIHTGYGLEFCLPGMVAEGAAIVILLDFIVVL